MIRRRSVPTSFFRPAALLVLAAVVVVTACQEFTLVPVRVRTVSIDPASVELVPGQRVEMKATASDADGVPMGDRSVEWVVHDGGVAVIEPDGRLHGVDVGETLVEARVEGVTGQAHVRVMPPPEPESDTGGTADSTDGGTDNGSDDGDDDGDDKNN